MFEQKGSTSMLSTDARCRPCLHPVTWDVGFWGGRGGAQTLTKTQHRQRGTRKTLVALCNTPLFCQTDFTVGKAAALHAVGGLSCFQMTR